MRKNITVYLITGLIIASGAGCVLISREHSHMLAAHLPDAGIVGQDAPVLLQLGSHRCPPCRRQISIIAALSEEETAFEAAFLDADAHPQIVNGYGVTSIPTLIFFDGDGNELFRRTGFYSREKILAKWKSLGVASLQHVPSR